MKNSYIYIALGILFIINFQELSNLIYNFSKYLSPSLPGLSMIIILLAIIISLLYGGLNN